MKTKMKTKQLLTPWLLVSLCALTAVAQTVAQSAPTSDWLLWGGPGRDFVAPATELLSSWPTGGPRKLWSRELGDGLSGIAVEGTTLYTAYRRGSYEVVTAIDAQTGKTLWVYDYFSPFVNFSRGVGDGPHAMPQIIGDRLVMASALGQIYSLDKKTGKLVWSHDLYKEFGATKLEHGYACHALPYKDSLILFAGERGNAALALKQSDSAALWKNMIRRVKE